MTEKDMDKLIGKMQGVFATAQDHVNLEEKVDKLTEVINKGFEDMKKDMRSEFATVRNDLTGLKEVIVYRTEYEKLLARVKRLEEAVGIIEEAR